MAISAASGLSVKALVRAKDLSAIRTRALEIRFGDWYPCNCIVCDPSEYRWHDSQFQTPEFSDLIIYQFHIGVFYARNDAGADIRPNRVCKILDVIDRIEYWKDLGVNAVMPLP